MTGDYRVPAPDGASGFPRLRARSGPGRLHVLQHRRRDGLQLQSRAELDELGAGLGHRYVSRRSVERIARFRDFLQASTYIPCLLSRVSVHRTG